MVALCASGCTGDDGSPDEGGADGTGSDGADDGDENDGSGSDGSDGSDTGDGGGLDCGWPPGSWIAIDVDGAPEPTDVRHTAWNGEQLLVFGDAGGGAYDPCDDVWSPIDMSGAPPELMGNASAEAVVAAGTATWLYLGAIGVSSEFSSPFVGTTYDPGTDSWTTHALGGNAPEPRKAAVITSVADRVVVWGGMKEKEVAMGSVAVPLGDGSILDPLAGTWTPIAASGAPSPRAGASWADNGDEVLVWGGIHDPSSPFTLLCEEEYGCGVLGDGAVLDPVANTWSPVPLTGAPTPRSGAKALWAGGMFIVWGGADLESELFDGARFDPSTRLWSDMAPFPAPELFPAWINAFADGDYVVLSSSPTAFVYDVAADTWTQVSQAIVPDSTGHGAIIYGTDRRFELAVPDPFDLGGDGAGEIITSIARVDPMAAAWTKADLELPGRPAIFGGSTAWTGEALLSWGGYIEVVDPDGDDGCGDTGENPCDPMIPTKRVYQQAGGLIIPSFQ